eukprot:8759838-Pyramimonas_sp.AAC.1
MEYITKANTETNRHKAPITPPQASQDADGTRLGPAADNLLGAQWGPMGPRGREGKNPYAEQKEQLHI